MGNAGIRRVFPQPKETRLSRVGPLRTSMSLGFVRCVRVGQLRDPRHREVHSLTWACGTLPVGVAELVRTWLETTSRSDYEQKVTKRVRTRPFVSFVAFCSTLPSETGSCFGPCPKWTAPLSQRCSLCDVKEARSFPHSRSVRFARTSFVPRESKGARIGNSGEVGLIERLWN